MEAPLVVQSHLSPVRREAPPVEPADDASLIEVPPEVLAQQRVDALEAKLDALLNGGPRYQPTVKEEPLPKKEAWGRAEGCAAVSALFDARAHEVCDLQQMQDIVGCPAIPESLTAFVQAQFQLTFRSKHITAEKLDAFCACVDEAISALPHFKGEGERGQARAERLALFRDSLTSLPCFDSMAVILQSLAKDGKLESIAQALPPVGDVMVPVRGGTLIARLPKLATDDPRGPPRVMSLHAKTCSITTVVRALAERDLLPDEEVLRYVLDELDVVPADARSGPVMVGGVLRQPSLNILDELLSEAGSRPGTALTDSSWRPGTAASTFRGIARCASALSSKAKSLKSRSRSTIPGREELPPNLMRLKKGLYVELHWLLRQLSGVEESQLSCSELMQGEEEEEEDDDLLTAVEEEPTPVKRMSTVAERRAAAEELQRRMDEEFGQQREGSDLKGATGDGVLLEEELHPVERVPTPEPVVRPKTPEDEYWGCAHSLLDEGGRDVSFEEIRTLTFLLRKRRLLTCNIRLPNSRTSTIRFGMRESVGECFSRLSKALKLTLAERKVARLCDLRGRPFALSDFMVKHVPHNNSTLLLLPVRPGTDCAPPLPPLEPGEEPDMSYVRHLREATTELARHDTKVDVRDRWGPQKPLPSAEKRHPPSVLAVAKARKRRARLVKYK